MWTKDVQNTVSTLATYKHNENGSDEASALPYCYGVGWAVSQVVLP